MRIKIRRRDERITQPHEYWIEEEIDIDEAFINSLSAAIANKILAAPVSKPVGRLKPTSQHHERSL